MSAPSPPADRASKRDAQPLAVSADSPAPPGTLAGRRIALCVTGSIAAYKAVLVLRLLRQEGAEVEVVLTRAAERFVGKATFAGLTGRAPLSDMFDPTLGGEAHVDLAARSDLVLIVPATADLLARLAQGRAEDLVTATALCARGPLLAAPAMHPAMWQHPATRRNVSVLASDARLQLIGPVQGLVASGERGIGRMAEPHEIVAAVAARLSARDLSNRHVVISAGPTVEDLDPVRFLGNRSSGKMGFALAERAALRGARVTLITGPVGLETPHGVHRIDVRSALAMQAAIGQVLGSDLDADALIMAAAVGDFRPAETHTTKIKREHASMTLELVQNPDILAELGRARSRKNPVLIGFAVEADEAERIIEHAKQKLQAKRVDLIVANHASDSFGKDDNRVTFVESSGVHPLGILPKRELADRILSWLSERWQENG